MERCCMQVLCWALANAEQMTETAGQDGSQQLAEQLLQSVVVERVV